MSAHTGLYQSVNAAAATLCIPGPPGPMMQIPQVVYEVQDELKSCKEKITRLEKTVEDLTKRIHVLECMPPQKFGGPEFLDAYTDEFAEKIVDIMLKKKIAAKE